MTRISLPLAALALVLPAMMPVAAAAQSVQDFQLPPNPTPTPSISEPQVQGPVDVEAPLETTPRQTPTNAPAPAAQSSVAPTVQPQPRTASRPAPIVRQAEQRFTPARQQSGALPSANPAARSSGPAIDASAQTDGPSPVTEESLPGFSSEFPSAQSAQIGGSSSNYAGWPWAWVLAFAMLVAGLLGVVFWRRQHAASAVPAEIAPPLVKDSASEPEEDPKTANGSDPESALYQKPLSPGQWVTIEARANQLQRSMLNATLTYRLVISNRSGKPLSNVQVEADLATAHGKLPVEEQIAIPENELTVRHTLERMAPGERAEFSGNILLPLSEVSVIPQGPKALLCIPLLRIRLISDDRDPLARTWVIGRQTAAGGRVQPFRFDTPPQAYNDVGQRPLD